MGFKTLNWSKLDYARWCTAALSYLVLRRRDWAGLVLFDTKVRREIPPGGGSPQALSLFKELEAATLKMEAEVMQV